MRVSSPHPKMRLKNRSHSTGECSRYWLAVLFMLWFFFRRKSVARAQLNFKTVSTLSPVNKIVTSKHEPRMAVKVGVLNRCLALSWVGVYVSESWDSRRFSSSTAYRWSSGTDAMSWRGHSFFFSVTCAGVFNTLTFLRIAWLYSARDSSGRELFSCAWPQATRYFEFLPRPHTHTLHYRRKPAYIPHYCR